MNDNDIIGVNKRNEDDNSNFNIDLDFNKNIINLTSNKRKTCSRLCSARILTYINHTPANFGGSCQVEVIAKEIWANRFKKGFLERNLTIKKKEFSIVRFMLKVNGLLIGKVIIIKILTLLFHLLTFITYLFYIIISYFR